MVSWAKSEERLVEDIHRSYCACDEHDCRLRIKARRLVEDVIESYERAKNESKNT